MNNRGNDIELESSGNARNGSTITTTDAGVAATKSAGLYFTIPIIIVILVGTALVFTGSILATYYGKTCQTCVSVDLDVECGDHYCKNQNILQTWMNKCPASTTRTTIMPTITTTSTPEINWRIPTSLQPYRYEITIQPYFRVTEAPTNFSGTAKIWFQAIENTDKLIFHAMFLDINNSTLSIEAVNDPSFSPLNNFRWSYDEVTSQVTVNLAEYSRTFSSGLNYSLYVDYIGYTTHDLVGFYRSSYTDDNGETHWLVTSQLEYIEARKCFPSFDEPGFKSVYKMTIVHDNSLTAMSNMPIDSSNLIAPSNGYNWRRTEFKDSPLMSSYLVGILISDFYCRSNVSQTPISGSVDVTVCARNNAPNDLDLAMEASVEVVKFFEEYYGVKYPLPKLDHVGVPTFKFGAMENWGIAIYLESNFLFNSNSTQTTEQNVVRIIAHEISHMWFGNLVTPKWWDDLWLNEGFARYAEHLGSNAIRPDWRMFDRLYDLHLSVMQSDSSDVTRPVSVNVLTPEQIDGNINPTITYGKGAAIVKMLTYILGEDTFTRGLTKYFNKFEYQNVDQFDLWESLHEQAISEGLFVDVDFSSIMASWTKQKGHPVITIRRISNNQIGIRQNRFILDSTVSQTALTDVLWQIPFTHSIETVGSTSSFTNQVSQTNLRDKVEWLPATSVEQTITLARVLTDDDFLIANLDMAGFYRVNYDTATWHSIMQQLMNHRKQLSARMRATIVSDVFSLTEATGYLESPTLAFELARFLANEDDYLPWNVFISRVSFYLNIFDSTLSFNKIRDYLADLSRIYYNKLGWIENVQTDAWTDRIIRNTLASFACRNNLPECVSTARQYFTQWMNTGSDSNIPRGYRSLTVCTSLYHGTQDEWQKIFDKAKNTSETSLRNDLLSGLACSREPVNQQALLDDQLSASNILTTMINVANRPGGYIISWNFLKANWNNLYARFNGSSSFPTLIRDISYRLKFESQAADFSTFFQGKSLTKEIQDSVNEAVTRVNSNINWYNVESTRVVEWFDSYVPLPPTKINFRLPTNLKPTLYDFQIKPYIGRNVAWPESKDFTFEGSIHMHFTCTTPTDRIVFHAAEMDIHQNSLVIQSVGNVDPTISVANSYEYDTVREFVIVSMNKECMAGVKYILFMTYDGRILPTLYGFYRSSYLDPNGNRVYLGTTQFQPTDARRALPCMDEPGIKSSFRLTLIRHKSFPSTFFNTPLVGEPQPDATGEWITERFEQTEFMSSYLVAFVISDFDKITAKSALGVEIEVAGKPHSIKAGEGEFALNEAAQIIDFFANYFSVPYPLQKSTQIAIPDFNAGAMENWGLITYREVDLLFNPARDQLSNQRRISSVVSHELAHQWFGNLVTPTWWNDLWLNEGFASWVEYLGYNHTHPDWKDLEFFFVQKLGPFVQDSLESSHPISVEVNDPAEINSLFDAISYSKGSSIIRMMNAFLTESTFRKGVSQYLKDFSFSNAVQDDLWESLTKAAHADQTLDASLTVKDIMDTWTLQKGYPLVTIVRNNNQLRLKQKWFLLDPENTVQGTPEYDSYRWYVAFTATTKTQQNWNWETPPTWFYPDQQELVINLPSGTNAGDWYIGNLAHAGWYRVNYDEENWNRLIEQLNENHQLIHPIHRAQLLDDSFNLGRAEVIDQLRFLDITKYLTKEAGDLAGLPFTPAFTGLNFMTTFIEDVPEIYDLYKEYYMSLLQANYDRLGWSLNIPDANDINLQLNILSLMCTFGNKDCVAKARSYYDDWLLLDKPLPNNFKNVIYQTKIAHGTYDDWKTLYDIAMNTIDNAEKLRMLRGLAASKDYNLLKTLLYKTSDPTFIREQDRISYIGTIAANSVSRRLAYDYMEEYWDEFIDRYGSASFTLPNLVTSCTSRLNKEHDLARVEDFVRRTPNLGVTVDAFKNAIETIKTNIHTIRGFINHVKPKINWRLPSDLYPFYYDLTIQPYFRPNEEPMAYDGKTRIEFVCLKDTDKLVLHSLDLVFVNSSLSITGINDTAFTTFTNFPWSYDSVTSQLTVQLTGGRMFRSSRSYAFSVSYSTKPATNNLGFYKTSYKEDDGTTKWILTSQLEYIEARKSFPCFDEPGFRSVFKVTIVHDNSMISMSNMPIANTSRLGVIGGYDWVQTEFKESEPMSTYLLAILVADYRCQKGVSNTPSKVVDVSVCARPNAYDQLDLALEASTKILEFFEDFYEAEYPLPKLDHIASPTFAYGAMENWGLAIYLESNFLHTPGVTSQSTEASIVRIIAHEISHMWFGNLVTPKWWNDLWLNEGFATFAEHVGTDSIRKDWRMFDRLMDQLLITIHADATEDTREVSADVETPEQINENINPTITYRKGGGLVQMLSYVLGNDTFTRGLSLYFKNHQFTNVDQFDLWTALYEQAYSEGKLKDVNLTEIMISWTKQKGHPVVNIKRDGNNRLILTQNRFVLDTTRSISSLNDVKWWIPFTHSIETIGSSESFTNQAGPSNLYDKIFWFKPDTSVTVDLKQPLGADDFIIANLDMGSFYRVNYDEADWKLIARQLISHTDQLSPRTRAQLISDAFGLTEANYITNGVAFELAKYLINELDYLPWTTFLNRIKYFIDLFDSTSTYAKMQNFLADIVTPYYRKLGWFENVDTDAWNDRLLRNNLVRFACNREQQECVNDAKRYFNDYATSLNLTKIPSGFRTLVLCVGVNQGGESEFNLLLREANKTSGSTRTDLLSGLACTKDPMLQLRYIDDPLVKSTNQLTALINVANRPNGYLTSWNYLKANWDSIYDQYSTSSSLTSLIRDISYRMKYNHEINDFNSFFAGKPINKQVNDAVRAALSRIRSNSKWFTIQSPLLITWFEEYIPLEPPKINFRLPDMIAPVLYDLTLKPYIGPKPDAWPAEKDWTFEATMKMTIHCKKATNKIVFHSEGLHIDANSLEISSLQDTNALGVLKSLEVDERREFVTVTTNRNLVPGANYTLHMDFTGTILTVLYGFYRSTYTINGVKKYLAVTDFEPTDARRAFPCMDEPALKAKFKLTLIRHEDFPNTWANTPLISSKPWNETSNWWIDEFEETVDMSTYLIAYAVTDFKNVSNTTASGKLIEVAARPNAIDNDEGLFALKEAVDIIDFFSEYFGIEYPLEKSTQIAIPDFNSGAMENWGLITYREDSLLYKEGRDLITNKRRVSTVVSHELAHQWFGNLVSPKWWNDLWLNEGFASWVEYLGYNHTHPDWEDLKFFFTQRLGPFVQDSLESSHPISVEVVDPAEIISLFDSISYSKGASIIRMMNAYLTEDTFRQGVSNYLKKFSFSNAEQDDLWESLTEQAHEDNRLNKSITVKMIMDTWTLQKGYPVVTMTRQPGNQAKVTQKWFLLNPLNKIENTDEYNKYRWYVPFTFTSQTEKNWDFETPPTWFEPNDSEITVTLPVGTQETDWIIGNLAHSGWYRVNYDDDNWDRLITQLSIDPDEIDVVHRAQLIDDSFNLGRAEIMPQTKFFDMSIYLANEDDAMPFVPAFSGLNFMTTFIEDDLNTFRLYKQYYMTLLDKTYMRLGWQLNIDNANDINLQLSTLSVMCDFGNADCKSTAEAYYNDWIQNDVPVPANFKSTVYSTKIKYGTEDDWWELFDKSLVEQNNPEKLRMLRALTASRDFALLKYLLYRTNDPDVVRSQDRVSLIGNFAANPVSRRLAYDYMEENWDEFFDLYGSVSFTLPNLVTSCTSRLNKQTDLVRVQNFVRQTPNLGPATEAFKNAIETIETNIRWTEINLPTINTWLITPRNAKFSLKK